MTTANKITISRIILAPVFIVMVLYYARTGAEAYRYGAIACFGIASLADGLDGYVARRFNQRSELGAVLDPLADKVLLVSAVILLGLDLHAKFVQIPLWLVGVVLGRDALLILGLAVIHFMAGKAVVRPRFTGKLATVLQMATILWTLLRWNPGVLAWLTAAAALFTGISGLYYIFDGVRQLAAHPSSNPSHG